LEDIEPTTEQVENGQQEPFGEQLSAVCDHLERVIDRAELRKESRARSGRTLSTHERQRLATIQSLLGPRLTALLADPIAEEAASEDAPAPDPVIVAEFAAAAAKLRESKVRHDAYMAEFPTPVTAGRPRWL
jgi:hypothetical protein